MPEPQIPPSERMQTTYRLEIDPFRMIDGRWQFKRQGAASRFYRRNQYEMSQLHHGLDDWDVQP